jgi:hypothetical protein
MNRTGVLAGMAILTAIIVTAVVANRASAVTQYVCPIDGQIFKSQAELIAHYQTAHPGVRIPIVVAWR